MSAKLLHALTEENPDLQKQIGCMTGIFQLFDRHHILTPRRITGQTHKRLPQGHSHLNNGNLGVEPDGVRFVQTATERNQSKNLGENRRVSMESSGASVSSSSCSSSFSSLDYKTSQPESHSSERIIFPETPSRDLAINQPNASQLGRHSLDFRDVVKDSINREPRGLSVKTTMKEEPINRVMKHKDSPRPLQLSKSVDGSFEVGSNSRPRVPVDFKESLRSPGKIRESPLNFNDRGERPRSSYEARDGSLLSIPKDAPRFSYDGRETRRSSFESRDNLKSTTKLRELPRLSLDSRESYMRGSTTDPKSNLISKDLQRSSSYNYNRTPNLQQEFESYKQPTSVVAKLMGLEGLPNSIPTSESQMRLIKTCPSEECDPFSGSSKKNDGSKQSRISSPRSSIRDPVSPRLRTPESTMRPVSPRFPIEPAPWKKLDGGRGSQKPASKNQEITTRASNSHPSVYAEIEKRLKELEFRQSDRDLRALKQILDAMQAKGLLEAKKEEDKPSFVSQTNNNNVNQCGVDPNPMLANRRNPLSNRLISATVKGATSPRTYESPIVIMKPAKLIEKSNIPASSVIPIDSLSGLRLPQNSHSVNSKKDPANNRSPKLGHRESATRTLASTDKKDNARTMKSSKSQQLSTENTGSSVRTSGSVSPRLQQKKLELEKRSRPPIPSSDPSKPRKQSTRQATESSSPGGKARARSSSLQKNDDQLGEISRESRNLSHQGDEISQQSDSNNSLNSQMDIEVTSADRSAESTNVLFQQGSRSPSRKAAKNSGSNLRQKKPSPRLSEDGLLTELATVTPEQPSPVSVLDLSFYRDDLPSPVKNISHALKDVEIQNCKDHPGEDEQNPTIIGPDLSSGINRTKLESIEHLVKKLRRLNSNHNEATTDYIASLCENTNPDHRYISEILLASGLLLRDLGPGLKKIQLHPSGHPINPDLFFVLEQTKASNGVSKDGPNFQKAVQLKSDQDKLHRKLVFDAVNEVLVQKLALVGISNEPWIQTKKFTGRTMNAQRLLKDLCSEIEQLQTNKKVDCSFDEDEDSLKTILLDDVMRRSENWVDFPKEVPVVALDLERLIFKDLIDEIVSGEAANQRAKTSRGTLAK
ncbi:protein of unknown function DUF4378 [Macleaya cordata]|uniref:DUF4378 domain-containing protein n=1 Tax=Macleaya cordata TaxID=56857 RepID=A0A200PRG1_MACCD|nr:protein of unknown function DUF4378 [Macleaya cordata]